MAQPGTTPIGAPIDTYAAGNTYATHFEARGQGGFRSVADTTERDLIAVLRRKAGMLVFCLSDGITYQLDADLTTWNTYTVAGIIPPDVMLKSVYDPNDDGIVKDSDKLQGQNGAYYLARTNHTGTQAQSTIVNLVSDLALKLNASTLGVTVAQLVAGTVPVGQLPFSSTAYLGVYNANTNTPTLTNGSGTAGQWVWTTVSGSAGPQGATTANQAVVYNGTIWEVGATITGSIISVNGYTGAAVVLDLDDIADTLTRAAVSPDEAAGIAASTFPITAANPAVSKAEITNLITVGNGVFMAELFSNGHTLGDGTLRILNTLTNPVTGVAYTNVSAGNVWTRVNSAYTINVATMSIDWIAHQEAYLAMQQDGYSKIISPGGRGYCINQTLTLPLDQIAISLYRRGLEFIFDGQGSVFYNRTGSNMIVLSRYFTNQSQISGLNSYLLDYDYHFMNWNAEGNGGNTLADTFIRLGATTHSTFNNIKTNNFGCGINCEFALELGMDNIKHTSYGLYGTKITPATWTGGGADISGVNVVGVNNHRCVSGSGKTPTAGIYTAGGGNLAFNLLTFEGYSGSVHHFLDQTVGTFTGESCCTLTNLYFETAGASRAAIKFEADKGDYFVNKWNNQVAYADMPVFIEAAHKSAPPAGVRQLFVRVENAATQQGNGGILPKFRNTSQHPQGYGPRWVVQYVNMPSNSWTSPKLNVAANWDTSTPFSSIPDDAQIINYIPSPI